MQWYTVYRVRVHRGTVGLGFILFIHCMYSTVQWCICMYSTTVVRSRVALYSSMYIQCITGSYNVCSIDTAVVSYLQYIQSIYDVCSVNVREEHTTRKVSL
jgi:hypothetical protein